MTELHRKLERLIINREILDKISQSDRNILDSFLKLEQLFTTKTDSLSANIKEQASQIENLTGIIKEDNFIELNPSRDKIEKIFSCIKVLNRLEDILLDKNFPKMPNEQCSKVITQNSSDTLTSACCGEISTHGNTLKNIFEEVIVFCKDIEPSKQRQTSPSEEDKFKKRFEFFQRLQALRKEIIVYLSK